MSLRGSSKRGCPLRWTTSERPARVDPRWKCSRERARRSLRSEMTSSAAAAALTRRFESQFLGQCPGNRLSRAVAQIPLRFSVAGDSWVSREAANSAGM